MAPPTMTSKVKRLAALPEQLRGKLRQHRRIRAIWAVIIALVSTGIFALFIDSPFLTTWELKTYDWRMMATRPHAPGEGENVALLYVDEPSLTTMKEMGISWPWPRELYANMLDFCRRGGARAVLFDLFFSEDSIYGVEDDEAFAAGVTQFDPAYFVLFASRQDAGGPPPPKAVFTKSRVPFEDRIPRFMPHAASLASLPLPSLVEAATGLGNVRTDPDVDGIYRRVPLLTRLGQAVIPHVSLKVVSDLTNVEAIVWPRRTRLFVDGRPVPLDRHGNLMINYIGGVDSYPNYPLAQVLISAQQLAEGKEPDLNPAVLAGRVVVVGVAAPGLYDLKPTPLARVYPGPEIHATLIDSLLRRDFIRPVRPWVTALVALAMALAAALGMAHLERLGLIAAWLGGFFGLIIGVSVLLFWLNIWMPIIAPVGAGMCAAFTMLLRRYLTEGRKRRAIRKAFGQYLSPEVVTEIAKDPENVRLGGEENIVTIFFSDIANFTTTAETMSPSELVALLNRYLTEVSSIIVGHEGTLDKYIGDAVMAFWGAPLKLEDHAALAVLTALEVQEKLVAFPELPTRIGIHTGQAVVGNIGSDMRFNYTAIGDTVNLASRLEGVNKQFGTRIIISETTYARVGTAIEARQIGRVRVKGRAEPIAIYEPLCPKGMLDDAQRARQETFADGMEQFFAGNFEAAHKIFDGLRGEEDPVVATYRTICDRFKCEPPPEPFDGVITFTTK